MVCKKKNLSWLVGVDRNTVPRDHCSASLDKPRDADDAEQWPSGQTFLSIPNSHDRFLYLWQDITAPTVRFTGHTGRSWWRCIIIKTLRKCVYRHFVVVVFFVIRKTIKSVKSNKPPPSDVISEQSNYKSIYHDLCQRCSLRYTNFCRKCTNRASL